MEELKYKEDIIQSRTGNLGSSDAKLIAQCAELSTVPQSAIKRLAIVKGFIENPTFTNRAMQYGDFIENQIFANLNATDSRWESNPSFVSKKYSRKNVGCLTHVDAVLQDDEKKVLTLVEMKATKHTFPQTREEYKRQLAHHWLLGTEKAEELGGYKVVLMLAHYCTDGVDLDEPFEFDPERLTVKRLRNMENVSKAYDLAKGMDVIDQYLEHMDFYTEQEEIPADLLPEKVKSQFEEVAQFLREIKERENKVEEFKQRLYTFLSGKGISKVKCDDFAFTVVKPTQQKSFDAKSFMNDYQSTHPRKAEKLRKQYTKVINKKGYVKISVNNRED